MSDLERAGIRSLPLASCIGLSTMAWNREVHKIAELFASGTGRHREVPFLYESVTELSGQPLVQLRADIADASPRLAELAHRLRKSMNAFGCGALLEGVGALGLDAQSRAMLVYALALCLGEPTATDRRQRRVIWDVKPRHLQADYFATYSEHDREAAFHTDTQYYPMPERYFVLYTMQAARCGGGRSVVRDARALREQLNAPATRWVARVLEQPLPFRVPAAFVTSDRPEAVQATLAPVFADTPFIRYRYDTLLSGLQKFAAYDSRDVRQALDAFNSVLLDGKKTAEFFMPSDALLLIDNHHVLHARTAFQDPMRHLLRIRVRGSEGSGDALQYPLLTKPSVDPSDGMHSALQHSDS
jgi:hypothetical protein